jgi:hypothetical protein
MPFRKKSQPSQPHESSLRKNPVENTLSSSNPSPSPKLKQKAAWLEAPLPQFYDQELASQMVQQGYYSSLEEAFIEVPESVLSSVRQKIEAYLLSLHPPIFWRNAPLPSVKNKTGL